MSFSRNDLINEISKDTHLRPELVNEVLSSLTDIAVERLLIDKEFTLTHFMKITSYEVENAKGRLNPKDPNSEVVKLGKQTRLRASVSPSLRKLFKLQNERFADKPGLINRDTWRGALKWNRENYERTNGKVESIKKEESDSYDDMIQSLLDD